MHLFNHFHQNSCCIAASKNNNNNNINNNNPKIKKRTMSKLELYFNDVLELNPYMKKPNADIKDFHDKVLENGVLPLTLLGEQFK
jgi:hypothetical protein